MNDSIINLMKSHNERIDNFIKSELPKLLGYETLDKISLADWFAARELIRHQHFYEDAHNLLLLAKGNGIDARIDMQSKKIVY